MPHKSLTKGMSSVSHSNRMIESVSEPYGHVERLLHRKDCCKNVVESKFSMFSVLAWILVGMAKDYENRNSDKPSSGQAYRSVGR